MSLTKSAGIYGSVHEKGLNLVLDEVKKQRPVWFNFGTDFFIDDPAKALLQPLTANQITPEDEIPIPGTDGQLSIDFIVQIGQTVIDFYRKTLSGYPPQITLSQNQAVLKTSVAVTLAYPTHVKFTYVRDVDKGWTRKYTYQQDIIATNLEVWAKVEPGIVQEPANWSDASSPMERKLAFNLRQLEIVDVTPNSLETVIETLCSNLIRFSFLQNLRLPTSKLVLDMFKIQLDTSVSPNPAIKGDRAEVWASMVTS